MEAGEAPGLTCRPALAVACPGLRSLTDVTKKLFLNIIFISQSNRRDIHIVYAIFKDRREDVAESR